MRESERWVKWFRIGRLQVGYRAWKHVYPTTSDRWVVMPFAIYDRKKVK